MGEVKSILAARVNRQGATTFWRGAEHRQRVVTIEWDPVAEWHSEGQSGVGCWYIWDEHSVCPYARQSDVEGALKFAGEVMTRYSATTEKTEAEQPAEDEDE